MLQRRVCIQCARERSTLMFNSPCKSPSSPPSPSEQRPYASLLKVSLGITATFVGTFLYFIADPTGPRAFLLGDAWIFSLPNQFFLDSSIHRGDFPFWNPLAFCGTPFAADPQTLAFYPLNLLRSLLTYDPTPFRTQTSWNILLFVHYQIAGIGMYVLSRQYGLSRAAAWTALVGFICSSQFVFNMITWVYHIPNVTWLPWILFFLNKTFSSTQFNTQLRFAICAATIYAMHLLGGGPVFMVIGTLLGGATFLINTVWSPLNCPNSEETDQDILPLARRILRNTILLSAFLGIGLLLSSPYLFASTEFAFHSIRADSVTDTYRNSFILECVFSLRDMIGLSFVYSATRGKPAIVFSGACVTVLAIASLFHPNRRITFFYGLLFLILADVIRFGRTPAIETPLAFLFDKITPFNVLKTEGWLCTVVIGLPLGMLAGIGVDAITKLKLSSTRVRLLASVATIYLGALAVSSIAAWLPDLTLARNAAGLSTHAATIMFCSVPILFFSALIGAIWRPTWRRWALVLPLFAFCETLVWNIAIPQKVETDSIFPCVLPMERLMTTPDWHSRNSRLAYRTQDCAMLSLRPNIGGYNPIYLASSGRVLLLNADFESHYTRFLESDFAGENLRWNQIAKRQFWLSRQVVRGDLPPMQNLFPAATTVFMPVLPSDTTIPIVAREDVEGKAVSDASTRIALSIPAKPDTTGNQGNAVWNLPPFQTPARHSVLCLRLVGNGGGTVEVTAYDNSADIPLHLRKLQIPAESGEVLLEAPLPDLEEPFGEPRIVFTPATAGASFQLLEAYLLSDSKDENSLIKITSLRANSAEVEIAPLPESRVLTFTDANYPGWKAYVDSKPAPMYAANGAFKSVVLGPGPHTVRLVYSPGRIYVGLLFSAATTIAIVCYLVLSKRGLRRAHTTLAFERK